MKKILFILLALMPLNMLGQDTPTPVSYSGKIYQDSNLDKMPEFPGGMTAFRRDVHMNFRIPEIDGNGNFLIRISFVIETDGTMTNFEKVNDPGFGLADEAIRVLSIVKKKWMPAVKDNKSVRSSFTLPIQINVN